MITNDSPHIVVPHAPEQSHISLCTKPDFDLAVLFAFFFFFYIELPLAVI